MARGAEWTFEDFCRVFCAPERDAAALAADLRRSVGAIEAVRASIEAVRTGKVSPTFPGSKWEDFVERALAGECPCGGSRASGASFGRL